jgi:hypothetical protein
MIQRRADIRGKRWLSCSLRGVAAAALVQGDHPPGESNYLLAFGTSCGEQKPRFLISFSCLR